MWPWSVVWPYNSSNGSPGKLATLRVQIKALVGQIAGAVLIQEAIHWLVISLPTEKLVAVRRELSEPGQIVFYRSTRTSAHLCCGGM